MRGEFFEFSPTHKLWVYGNHKPVVRGTDEGIWRRIRLIPFEVTIPGDKQDHKLPAKLRAELPGILAWAVQGCLDWQRDGLGTPAEVKAATEAYRAEMDVIAEFLAESCVMTPNAEATKTALYAAYQTWCESSGERSLSKIAFGRRIKERGIAEGTTGRMKDRAWLGVGLLASESADNADKRGQFFKDSANEYDSRSVYSENSAGLVRVVRAEEDQDGWEEGEL
jgi:putative DNA primase/helicase